SLPAAVRAAPSRRLLERRWAISQQAAKAASPPATSPPRTSPHRRRPHRTRPPVGTEKGTLIVRMPGSVRQGAFAALALFPQDFDSAQEPGAARGAGRGD